MNNNLELDLSTEADTYDLGLWCPNCLKDFPDHELNDLGVCMKCGIRQIEVSE